MTEDMLAMRDRGDAFVLLDIHQHRRASGVPTVSTIVGETIAESRALAFAWAADRAIAIVRADGDLRTVVERWFASTFLRPNLRTATQRLLAARLGCPETESLNRYRDDPRATVARFRATHPAIAATILALGAGEIAPPSAWEHLVARDESETGLLQIVRTVVDLYGREQVPALLLASERSGATAERHGDEIVRLAESTPALCVIVAATDAIRSLFLGHRHAGDLIAEGVIYLGIARERFFDDPDIAAAIREAESARDAALRSPASGVVAETDRDRARSAAERALKMMLDCHPVTQGRFELNATIGATFGNRAAEIDLLDARMRIALEVDGYHHFQHADHYRRDRRKDAMLQAEGYLVLRTLADDVVDRPHEVLRNIVHAVQQRDLRGE